MNAALDPVVSRFTVRQTDDEEAAEHWRGQAHAFLNLYAFLSQVIPYQDSDLERSTAWLLRFRCGFRPSGAGLSPDASTARPSGRHRAPRVPRRLRHEMLIS